MKLNVRKGDAVMVIAGKDKGKSGEVLSVNTDSGRIVVRGVNIVHKSIKPRKAQDKGGIVKREGTIDASNVMVICHACGKPTRIGHIFEEVDGKNVKRRVCKKCDAVIEEEKAKSAVKKAKKAVKKAEKDKPETDVAESEAVKSPAKKAPAKKKTAEGDAKPVKKAVKKTEKAEGENAEENK